MLSLLLVIIPVKAMYQDALKNGPLSEGAG